MFYETGRKCVVFTKYFKKNQAENAPNSVKHINVQIWRTEQYESKETHSLTHHSQKASGTEKEKLFVVYKRKIILTAIGFSS